MTTNTATETARPPVAKCRIGLILASIWCRETPKDNFYSVTFERLYEAADGSWKSTHSFSADEMPQLAKLSELVFAKIAELKAADTV